MPQPAITDATVKYECYIWVRSCRCNSFETRKICNTHRGRCRVAIVTFAGAEAVAGRPLLGTVHECVAQSGLLKYVPHPILTTSAITVANRFSLNNKNCNCRPPLPLFTFGLGRIREKTDFTVLLRLTDVTRVLRFLTHLQSYPPSIQVLIRF